MHAAKVVIHKPERNSGSRFSIFLKNAFVSRVNRRMLILIDRFCLSTKDVETCFGKIGFTVSQFGPVLRLN